VLDRAPDMWRCDPSNCTVTEFLKISCGKGPEKRMTGRFPGRRWDSNSGRPTTVGPSAVPFGGASAPRRCPLATELWLYCWPSAGGTISPFLGTDGTVLA